MQFKLSTLLPLGILLSVFSLPSNASLVGSSVAGSLTFSGDPSNYFDPGYGFVPAAGYLNASGTTVTVSGSAVEFGYDDGFSLISANFSDNQLTISDTIELSGSSNGFQMMFTDASFSGLNLVPVSDTFPLSDYSLVGEVITVDYSGGNPTIGQTFTATFDVASAPEPSTLGFVFVSVLMTLGACLIQELRRRGLWN